MSAPAAVYLWDFLIGALSYPPERSDVAVFEYNAEFLSSGREVAPLTMPLSSGTFHFPDTSLRTFKGLPGMLADSLPDRFGNQLIDQHLASEGVPAEHVTAIDRLLYVGTRAMGALEYRPARDWGIDSTESTGFLNLSELTELANLTLSRTAHLSERLSEAKTQQATFDLLRIGTSAGGARAKALVAFDAEGRAKVGHVDHGADHTYWLLKFDGIAANKDRDHEDPPGMTTLEYVYSTIARDCGIQLPRCKLLEDGDQRHFLIERFDRVVHKNKVQRVHYTSWCGMAHAHRDTTGAYGYEQLVLVMRQLQLPHTDFVEIFRRAAFNVVGKNQDDHTKNFGFTMSRQGVWALSPAFDLTYAYDPLGRWTKTHQISLNGKVDDFVRADLLAFGRLCNLSDRESGAILDTILDVFATFSTRAQAHALPTALERTVSSQLRTNLAV